jgi:hypothetical protein
MTNVKSNPKFKLGSRILITLATFGILELDIPLTFGF